jgi:hypothetical protein
MTTITITVNLSDLVDVINNSNTPMVCKHLLCGGSMQDLVKFGDHDRFLHKLVKRVMTDGTELEAVVILESYDPWTDKVTLKLYEGDKEALRWNRIIGWEEWLNLPTVDYSPKWGDEAEPSIPSVIEYDDPLDYNPASSREFNH